MIRSEFVERLNVEQLGEARWTQKTTWMFISFVLGLALESYVYSLSSIAIYWVTMPKALGELLLAWAPIWLIIGIIVAGPFSDRYGRKVTLYTTLVLYAIGGIILFFSFNYVVILISLAIMLIAGGGEMNSIMVASHELMPRKHRGKATMMIINGINLGGMVLAILALSTAALSSKAVIDTQRNVVAIAILIVVAILFATRVSMPESFLWLQKRGRNADLEKVVTSYFGSDVAASAAIAEAEESSKRAAPTGPRPGLGYVTFTMVVMILVAAANTIGFGLMAYALAFAFFPHLQPTILAVFEGAGFVIGFLGLIADRVSRKKFLFWSFLGTFAMTVVVGLTTKQWQHNMTLFWVLLIVLAGVNSLCYLTEDTVKAEVWPTLHRGTLTAVARFISIGLYIPTIYITANMSTTDYVLFNAGVWLIGTLASAAWLIWGRETGRGLSIQEASGEA
ncbi:MFS transporter [Alicyclobacillus mengziensis]|uniref:MFS transporter n=1 Tax=Alicyclobacillus mengziensis TaxID=2931921 RepID=A0A9X7VWG0_9BACL|nr:MFS transporter [Alicyclobacillus mengziensis]